MLKKVKVTSADWGDLYLAIFLPYPNDPLGDLSPLRSTDWEEVINVVSGMNYSHALKGVATPLMHELRYSPEKGLIRFKQQCAIDHCIMRNSKCITKKKMPECLVVSGENAELKSLILHLWSEGYYIVVVEGDEFW